MAKRIERLYTFEEAVAEMFRVDLRKRGVFHGLGLNKNTLDSYKRRYKMGKLSIETQRALLKLCGYRIEQVELWK
jgi:hypothetical protein